MSDTPKIDWLAERSAFPVCAQKNYLASSATTPLRQEVLQATQTYLSQLAEAGELPWWDTLESLDESRTILSRLLGGQPVDYGFGANTSHNMNLLAMALQTRAPQRSKVISLQGEFPSTVTPWKYQGFEVLQLPLKADGNKLFEDVLNSIDSNTTAVVVSAVQFANGYRISLRKWGLALKERGIPFIVNATQAFAALPINVDDCAISALTVSSHKWLGALYGTSLLFTSESFRADIHWPIAGHMSFDDPEFVGVIDSPKTSTSFVELGTPPFVIWISVLAALKEVERLTVPAITRRLQELSAVAADLAKKHKIPVLSHRNEGTLFDDSTSSQIISLQLPHPKELVIKAQQQNIVVTERHGGVRLAPHYFNTETEIEKFFNFCRQL